MYKAVLVISLLVAACSNSSDGSGSRTDSFQRPATALPTDPMARNAELSFIDGCLDNAKTTLGEQKGYAFCKCIYEQMQAKNPGMDSAAMDRMAQDTAQINAMAANCR